MTDKKPKIISLTLKNEDMFILAYLNLWNGDLRLTRSETKVVAVFVKRYLKLRKDKLPEPYLSEVLFSDSITKELREGLDMNRGNFSNYKKQIKAKGVIIERESKLSLNPIIIPEEEVLFKFKIEENGKV